MKSFIGYIISGIGLVFLAVSSLPPVRDSLKLPSTLSGGVMIIISLVLIVLGIFIVMSENKKISEVPIFEGKKVVGYRRI